MDSLFSDEPLPKDDLFSDEPAPEQIGAFEAAGRGALRNFPLAQQAAAAAAPINPWSQEKTYGAELQHLTEAAEQAKKAQPGAYGTGAVAGSLAPLALGPVGGAMKAAPILANAALGAGQSISDINLTENPFQALKQAGVGGVIGGATAGVMNKLMPGAASTVAREAAEAIEAPVAAEAAQAVAPAAAEAAAPAAQVVRQMPGKIGGLSVPNKTVAADFTPSAERIYASNLAQGLGGTPRQLMKVFGKRDPVATMNEIGNWMNTASPEGTSLHSLLDRPGELLSKVSAVNKNAGRTIGEIIDDMGPAVQVDREGLKSELLRLSKRTADSDTKGRIRNLIEAIDDYKNEPQSDFEVLQQIKKMAGKQIAKDPEMASVYGHLSDKMTALVDEYGNAIKNPELRSVYNKAKVDYHQSSRILPILRYAEAKDVTGGPGGHHTLRGLLASIYNMATETVGLPETSQLAKNVHLKAAPAMRSVVNAGEKAREAIPGAKMNPAAQVELANFLESQFNRKKQVP